MFLLLLLLLLIHIFSVRIRRHPQVSGMRFTNTPSSVSGDLSKVRVTFRAECQLLKSYQSLKERV